MTVLAIETATAVCSVALVSAGNILGEESAEARNLHAERLLEMIDRTLGAAGLAPGDLDGVAVSNGPGSFTGLRIGLSVAKGLVFGLSIPLVAVPTLAALAWRLRGRAPGAVLAAIDARRDEVYCQLFRESGGEPAEAGPPQDRAVAAIPALLAGEHATVTGDGAEKVMAAAGARGLVLAEAGLRTCSAVTVGVLGERRLAAGRHDDPATLEPWYIKEFFLRVPLPVKEGE